MTRIPLTEEEVSIAKFMLEEMNSMNSMKLTVIKIPGDPDKLSPGVRAAICSNPDWYSRFCNQFLVERLNKKWKRPRTKIKRCDTITCLERMIRLRSVSDGIYCTAMVEAIEWVRWRFVENAGLATSAVCSSGDSESF